MRRQGRHPDHGPDQEPRLPGTQGHLPGRTTVIDSVASRIGDRAVGHVVGLYHVIGRPATLRAATHPADGVDAQWKTAGTSVLTRAYPTIWW